MTRMRLNRLFTVLCLIILSSRLSEAQFFRLPGDLDYALNSVNDVFDITPDGSLAVTLEDNLPTSQAALLVAFNPISGETLDSKTFGFGALEVRLAQTANGYRVFVLTSEGGPRMLWIFALAADGKLTQLNSLQLTTSIDADGSNLAISSTAQAGVVIVDDGPGIGSDLVTFSLNDGSIIGRLFVGRVYYADERIGIAETAVKQTVVFLKDFTTIGLVDISQPSQPVDLGGVSFPTNTPMSTVESTGVAFSADNRYAFVSEWNSAVAVVDLQTQQTIATISGNYEFGSISVYDNGTQRLLLLQAYTTTNTASDHGLILLVDASNVSQPVVVNHFDFPTGEFFYRDGMAFSPDGKTAVVQTGFRLLALNVTDLSEAWQLPVPGTSVFNPQISHEMKIFGTPARILAAWGSGDSLFALFPVDKKRKSQLTSN